MIYQCYPTKEIQKCMFFEEPYEGFGLEPEANKDLFNNCPELEDAYVRLQLTEYACFLWHWRNEGSNPDGWFGTTSHRQLEKAPTIFSSKQEIEDMLEKDKIVGWGHYNMVNNKENPITLKIQTDVCHPGLNDYTKEVFNLFGHVIPEEWDVKCNGFFANYWVMSNELFKEFMDFSWPTVEWSLKNVKDSNYYKNHPTYGTVSNKKATGYFMERLFIFWYLIKGIDPFNAGPTCTLHHTV